MHPRKVASYRGDDGLCGAPRPVGAIKIPAALRHSSFSMVFVITDRRKKGAPIRRPRGINMRPEGPTTAAFKTCRTSFPQVPAAFQAHLIRLFGLLVFCAMSIVWAAPVRAVIADPVRGAAT